MDSTIMGGLGFRTPHSMTLSRLPRHRVMQPLNETGCPVPPTGRHAPPMAVV